VESITAQDKNIIRIVLGTALILLVPLVAMQFTDEMNWNWFDFAVVGVLLIGTGLMYQLATRKGSDFKCRAAVGVVLVAALLVVWAELAAGVFGTPVAGS
jgi:cell division protein FtsW (lipid II flippase)